ncbi:MAG: hypothetical protein ACRD51_19180, partial [Candidatus Acidiferrum sp.]
MKANGEDGARARWLKKKVLDSRVLDSMENLSAWTFTGDGASGKFRVELPQGRYSVSHGAVHTSLTALSGGIYHIELRPSKAFDFDVSTETTHDNEVTLRIHAEGAGVHTLEVKTYNVEFHEPGTQRIELRAGHDAELVRQGHVRESGT